MRNRNIIQYDGSELGNFKKKYPYWYAYLKSKAGYYDEDIIKVYINTTNTSHEYLCSLNNSVKNQDANGLYNPSLKKYLDDSNIPI